MVGFFGFFGFMGFRYFYSHDPGDLFYFTFFAFFGYFLLGKVFAEIPDERYIENRNRALAGVIWVPLAALYITGALVSYSFATKEFVVLVSAVGWAAAHLCYALLFLHYEKQ
jgi:hypothetical protein